LASSHHHPVTRSPRRDVQVEPEFSAEKRRLPTADLVAVRLYPHLFDHAPPHAHVLGERCSSLRAALVAGSFVGLGPDKPTTTPFASDLIEGRGRWVVYIRHFHFS
jgi:hypothetical protein